MATVDRATAQEIADGTSGIWVWSLIYTHKTNGDRPAVTQVQVGDVVQARNAQNPCTVTGWDHVKNSVFIRDSHHRPHDVYPEVINAEWRHA